jgi:hypothetical protein
MIRIAGSNTPVGAGLHRSGWPFVVNALRPLCSRDGILLDDFVERSFGWAPLAAPHAEPWIGVFHFPPQWPVWLHPIKAASTIIQDAQFQLSLPNLRLAVALSDYLADWLRNNLAVPAITVMHPTQRSIEFSEAEYLSKFPRKAIQIGWTLRNTRAIYQLPTPGSFSKIHIRAAESAAQRAERRLIKYWAERGDRSEVGRVQQVTRVSDIQYDRLLASSVVFLEFFDISASTTVVDCIVRNTPLLVNRLPALEEYLGRQYPLFYERIEDAVDLLTDDGVVAAHRYLRTRDKRPFTSDSFAATLCAAVDKVLAVRDRMHNGAQP